MNLILASVLLFVQVPLAGPQASPEARTELVGRYSNIRYTAEHAYGYLLEVWRDRQSVTIIWARANGPQADFDTVLGSGVRWDTSSNGGMEASNR
jgi:hypothetical protein